MEKKFDVYIFFIFVLLAIIWGSSFILIKKSLLTFTPLEVSALRVSISSLCFAPFVFYLRKSIPWKKLGLFIVVGLTGSGIPSFLYPIAQTEISSSLSGVLNGLTPIFTFLFGLMWFKRAFSKNNAIGVLLGFIGSAIMIVYGERLTGSGNEWYAIFVELGTVCYGFNVNFVESFFKGISALMVSSVSFFIIGPPAMLYLIFKGNYDSWLSNESFLFSLASVCTLSILATVICTIIFFHLIKKTNGVFSASVSYLIPVVAILWGILDGEAFGINHLVGMLLILSGVYLIKRKK